MGLADKYRAGSKTNLPVSNYNIDSLATLESINKRQGWLIAGQIATIATIAHQTTQTVDAIHLVNNTLRSIEGRIQDGFENLEDSINRLESNLLENLNEIKWFLFNVDKSLGQLINLVKFSGATKSAEYNKQGFVLYKIGHLDQAIAQYQKSLDENPLNIEAYINMGFAYLRSENLDRSIEVFETASKIIKEDFSYHETIAEDRVKSTEVFIWDNLAELYALKETFDASVSAIRKNLDSGLNPNTEAVSKFKLAKYSVQAGDPETALGVMVELIEQQQFDTVSLAVSHPEFAPIASEILTTLQSKLEGVKESYKSLGDATRQEIGSLQLDEASDSAMNRIIQHVREAISDSDEYALLLSDWFKERHRDFHSLLKTVGELKREVARVDEQIASEQRKLESISEQSKGLPTLETVDDDISTVSHKLLMSKVQKNVLLAVSGKLRTMEEIVKHQSALSDVTNKVLSEIENDLKSNGIEHLMDRFDGRNPFRSTLNMIGESNNEDVKTLFEESYHRFTENVRYFYPNNLRSSTARATSKRSASDADLYESVTIGDQVWMVRNLDVDTFRNGDPIPHAETDEDWDAAWKNKEPAWCFYKNDPANGGKYGKLYNWHAVNDPRGLAPDGWHVPTDDEWTKLEDHLGEEPGHKLKAATGWNDNGNGSDEVGFAGLPGGFRINNGRFDMLGKLGSFWSSSEGDSDQAWLRAVSNDSRDILKEKSVKLPGFSVRCLMNETMYEYYDIKKALENLLQRRGFIIIYIDDYYVQFANDLDSSQLVFEAVSSTFISAVGNKEREFKKLSFKLEPSNNYYKIISHNDFSTELIIKDIKTIFESIYLINFSSYIIEYNYED